MNSKEKSSHDASKVAKFFTTDPIEIDRKVNEQIKHLLREYSHVPDNKTIEHVLNLVCINLLFEHSRIKGEERDFMGLEKESWRRERAFQIFPYACIGQLRFLTLSLRAHPAYPEVLRRLIDQNQTLLDVGCCFAQDLRQLVLDGVPSERLYGVDVDQKFPDLGYELFLDKHSLKSTFLAVDMLDSDAEKEVQLIKGRIDIVWAASFLHLFPWDRQVTAVTNLVHLLKPRPGSLVMGRQLGSVRPGEYDVMKDGRWQYRHDVRSFERLWGEVGKTTQTRWRVEANLDEVDFGYAQNKDWGDPEMRRLLFAVYRE